MSEFPMIFSSDMVRRILAGQKTSTRRIANPQPPDGAKQFFTLKGNMPGYAPGFYYWLDDHTHLQLKQRYDWHIGDQLWVRETVKLMEYLSSRAAPSGSGRPAICYKANKPDEYWESIDYQMHEESFIRWTPAIYMPKWATRLWLEITDLEIQRLRDIQLNDIIKEGWVPPQHKSLQELRADEAAQGWQWWNATWKKINKIPAWEDNRVVIVIEFKVIRKDGAP